VPALGVNHRRVLCFPFSLYSGAARIPKDNVIYDLDSLCRTYH